MKGYTIKLFMWPFQGHMRFSLERGASSLFKVLDSHLKPRIILVGILDEEREDSYPICLEPEDCGYSVDLFSGIKELAAQLKELDERNGIIVGDARSAKKIAGEVVDRSYANAIKSIIKTRDLYGEKELFISMPARINGYQVFAVLVLDKKVFDSYYSLIKQKESQFSQCPISRSFIESTVKVFLNECTAALKKSEEPINATRRSPDELLREAGADFVKTVGWAGGGLEGTGIYEACNDISALKYEGTVGIGDMIIAPKGHPNVRLSLELANPISIQNHRMVRKFLELSNNTTSIVTDASLIYGLGEIRGHYNPQEENLFVVQFLSHYKWKLLHNRNPMLVVEYREPALPKDKINRAKFYSDLPRVFQGITKEQIDDLREVAIEATTQEHGTMLVISDDAKNESARLGRQCFVVKPFKLTDEKIQ